MEVDQTFIAAILTIIGYSINDTVVVSVSYTHLDVYKRQAYVSVG